MGQRVPYVTISLLAIMGLVAWKVTGFFPTEASLSPMMFSREAAAEGEWSRLVTSLFAHGGLIHLGFNALALWSLGSLEEELGSPAFLGLFLAAGVGGNLLHVMTTPTPVVGASGAIFGLLGVLLALAPRTQLSLFFIPVPAIVLLPLYAAVVLFVPGFQELAPIAHFAHLGGLIVGVAASLILDPRRAVEHAAYVGVAFIGLALIVVNVTAVGPVTLFETIRTDGIVGLLSAAWPSLVGLAVVAAAFWGLPDPRAKDRHAA